ncbi:MAG: restriction endonuclease subunit S [Clostridia bacterium]|nr:restriction endonuclease subunit S [Clostridia bacterium]
MMKNDKKWDAISIDAMFNLERGRENNMAILVEGDIPLVSARKVNNGIKGFIANPAKIIIGGKVITLNNDGDGGAGLAYFQPTDFALDTHVTALHPRCDISPDALLYMTASISKQHSIFGHGRSISLPRAKRIKNMIPVTDNGMPDYEYMSDYTSKKRKILLIRYRTYIEKRISELGEYIEIQPLNKIQWSPFLIAKIFNIFSGKRLVASDSTPGKRPFIGALDNSNGIARFVSDKNSSLDRNVLGVNYDGNGMVIGFYHPYECIFSDSVKRFHLKSHEDNAYILLFMKVVILQQKSKFGYLYKFNAERMEHTRIMLPVDNEGNIDYEYMDQYAKNMMLKKYKQYLAFLDDKEKGARVQIP